MGELSISYFRKLLSENVKNLENSCKLWEKINSDSSLPENVHDEIRTTIGLTHLLMRQKLKQFEGLIDDSDLGRGEKEITCSDLQGFWDMVYNEVEKIQRSFQRLEKCKENQWVFVQEEVPTIETKKKLPNLVKTVVSSQKHVSAARQRLAEAKLKMKQAIQNETSNKTTKNIIAGIQKVAESKKVINEDKVKKIKETNRPMTVVSNITNKQKSQAKEKQDKTQKKTIRSTEKENIITPIITDSKPLAKKSKKENPKNFIPLACITRSAAKRAMLENHQAD